MLYQFETLDNKMDDWGFPQLKSGSGFQVIKQDFEEAYRAGNIRFGDDGIYLDYEGKEYRGYMFIKEAYITYNEGPVKFPKFHLTKCDTIQNFISTGWFKQRYEWSNSNKNDLIDKQTRTEYKDIKLKLCSYCKGNFFDEIEDTEDFFATLDSHEVEETSKEVDIFGYDREWQRISRAYRKKMEYICEECGIEIPDRTGYRYLHTHHINGDKINNRESNLECLCVLCHAYKDLRHEENFDRKRMKNEIRAFISKYRDRLGGNNYLTKFDRENPT